MTPPPNAVRLIGHQRRFAEAIAQIDTELEFAGPGRRRPTRRGGGGRPCRLRAQRGLPWGTRAWDAVFPTASTARRGWRRPSGWHRSGCSVSVPGHHRYGPPRPARAPGPMGWALARS